MESPSYLVIGLGAIGSVVGGLLHKAGCKVTAVGRGSHTETVKKSGLSITGLWGDHRIEGLPVFSSLTEISGPVDIVLVAVKSYQTAGAVTGLAKILAPDGVAISLQNGLGNLEVIAGEVGWERTCGGRVIFGVEIPQAGTAKVTVYADKVLIGPAAKPVNQDLVTSVARDFNRAGIPTAEVEDIRPHLWAKVLYNLTLNPLAAILNIPYGRLLESDHCKAVMAALIEEAFEVAAAQNVFLPFSSASEYRDLLFSTLIPATAGHHASMLQDLAAGRKTEISALNGAIVQLGNQTGVETPVNSILTRLIAALEDLRKS